MKKIEQETICSTVICSHLSEMQREEGKRFSMARIRWQLPRCIFKICRKAETRGQSAQKSGGVWVTKPFQNWKKAVEKMKAHASSEPHLKQSCWRVQEKQLYSAATFWKFWKKQKPESHQSTFSLHSLLMQTAHSSYYELQQVDWTYCFMWWERSWRICL